MTFLDQEELDALRKENAELKARLSEWERLKTDSQATHLNILRGTVALTREAALHLAGAQDHDELKAQLTRLEAGLLSIRCIKHLNVPQLNKLESSGGECPICEIENRLDLQNDEFKRIRSLTDNDEIKGLCDRAVTRITQHTPVIKQRDDAVAEWEKERRRVVRLESLMAKCAAAPGKDWLECQIELSACLQSREH